MYEVDPDQTEIKRTAMQVHDALQLALGASAPNVFIPAKNNGLFDVTCTREQGEALLGLLRRLVG